MAQAYPKDLHGHLGATPTNPTYEVMLIDDVAHKIHQVIVHSFTMGDVEDPEIYAAGPLLEWEQSENGKWIMERAVEPPTWHQQQDYNMWGFKYVISAKLREQDAIIWALKN